MKKLIVVTLAAFAGATFAAGPKEGPKVGPGPRPMMMEGAPDPVVRLVRNPKVAKEIGLSDEQKKKIDEINSTDRETMQNLQKTVREAMKKQTELLKAEKIDEEAVMAEIDKAFDARKEMAKAQTRRVISIKSILAPEQVKKALEIIQSRAATRRPKIEAKDPKPPKAASVPPAEKPATAKD